MMLLRSSATATVNRTLRSFSSIELINDHVSNNVSPAIASKVGLSLTMKRFVMQLFLQSKPMHVCNQVGRNLHLQKDHPLNNIRVMIENHFREQHRLSDGSPQVRTIPTMCAAGADPSIVTRCLQYNFFSDLSPIVTVAQNFDQLLTPEVQ